MLLIEEELAAIAPENDTLLTIGVFDGVHIGHKYLISRLKEYAGKAGLASVVVTFRKHPLEILDPGTVPPYLTSCEEKVELLKAEGVDHVVPLTFTPEMANITAAEFTALLQKYLRMRGLVIGPDFSLGKNREGNVARLTEIGKKTGFTVTVVEARDSEGEIVSSTLIRQHLHEGDFKTVSRMLGRTFSLHGILTKGDARGRTLGFPTANIAVDAVQSLLPEGVYATWLYIDGEAWPSVTNIGERPTFNTRERTVETFVIGFSGDLYGRELKLDIIDLLRRETKFNSVEDLKKQITADIENSKAALGLPAGSSDSTCSC